MKQDIIPIRRDVAFSLSEARLADWHGRGIHVSYFFNALSLFFPDGERFFIDSVRRYRKDISDPVLKAQVRGFIAQEALHGREHEAYNDAIAKRGMPVDRYQHFIRRRLDLLRRFTSARWQLAVTIALEHLTSILAGRVLQDARLLDQCDPQFAALWRWHAMEETEHKAVAFDVYRVTSRNGPGAYLRRCGALLLTTMLFTLFASALHVRMLKREGALWRGRGWLALLNFLWGRPGMLRRLIPQWLDYFRPGFHPWDHDNRADLYRVESRFTETAPYFSIDS